MLKKIWNIWKKFGKFIGTIIGTIITTVLYIIIITPFGIIIRLGTDYLNQKKQLQQIGYPKVPKIQP